MPCLQSMIDHGVMGRLGGFNHLRTPAALWTTVLTGHRPEVHGILDALEPASDGQTLRLIGAGSRRVSTLWNQFSHAGRAVIHVGWPASHPAEPVSGVGISNLYDRPIGRFGEPWPLANGSVHPDSLAEDLAELRMHPGEFSAADLRPLLPLIESTDLAADHRPFKLAEHLAISFSRQAAFTFLLQRDAWDFAAVLFPTAHRVANEFYRYHPPQSVGVSDGDYARYSRVVRECLCLDDQMLAPILECAGRAGATVVLCSQGGLQPPALRVPAVPGATMANGVAFHSEGWCVIQGQGIRADELLHGGHLMDLAPTLRWLGGLPRDPSMPGLPLVRAWTHPAEIPAHDSWKSANSASIPRPILPSGSDVAMALAPPEASEPVREAVAAHNYHLGLAWLDARQPAMAVPLLESARGSNVDGESATLALIACHRALGRIQDAQRLLAEIADGAGGEELPGRAVPELDLMRGLLASDEGLLEEAFSYFEKALAARPQMPEMHQHLGGVLLKLRRPAMARDAFLEALRLDPESAEANLGLAQALYRLRQFPESVQPALNSATRMPGRAVAHLILGLSLARIGAKSDAITALENALRSQPGNGLAHRVLARLYRAELRNAWLAKRHSDAAMAARRARNAHRKGSSIGGNGHRV